MEERTSKSVREFFSFRYSVPGFVFMIVTLSLCTQEIILFFSIYEIQSTNIIQIILTLFALIGSTPIGFLFSQCWHFIWTVWHEFVHPCIFKWKPFHQFINDFKIEDKREYLVTTYHYISNSFENPIIQAYVYRRWDIVNTLSTSIFSIFGGIWLSYQLKIIFYSIIIKVSVNDIINYKLFKNFNTALIYWYILIIIFMFISIYKILYQIYNMVLFEMRRMGDYKLKCKIPADYFQKNQNDS